MSIKSKVVTVIILIAALMLTIGTTVCFAAPGESTSVPSIDDMASQAKNFIDQGKNSNKVSPDNVASVVKPIARILLAIGTVVVVVAGAVMGIKYMTASPDEQGKLKTRLVGLVVATIVIYAAYGIWAIAYNIMTDLVQ